LLKANSLSIFLKDFYQFHQKLQISFHFLENQNFSCLISCVFFPISTILKKLHLFTRNFQISFKKLEGKITILPKTQDFFQENRNAAI